MLSVLLWASLQGGAPHAFEYRSDRPLESVHLAGTFNGWDKGATPMAPDGERKVWRTSVRLGVGKHLYKFVLDGDIWILDPTNNVSEDDGGGNVNSVLTIQPADYAHPAAKGDGEIAVSALRHLEDVPDRNLDRGRLHLTLRARPGDIERVELLSNGATTAMAEVGSDGFYARFSTSVPWDGKRTLRYLFRCVDGNRTVFVGPSGPSTTRGAVYTLTESSFKPFVVPHWVESTVIYQIFPDRFANGDPRNDPQTVVAWDADPTYYNRFGGDVAGVRGKRGYLKDLGIGAIYFNPVFASPSNHRYETTDYERIDPEFGSNSEFAAMTREFERDGIRTILDGVFNHTAVDYAPFADIRAKGQQSAFKDWFFIHSYPVRVGEKPNYEAWFGFPSMPKVNLENPEARKALLQVPAFWHGRASVAGWRLDVANEVPMDYWRDFRKRVKALDSQTWIVGEVWGDGSPWLKGDQWDSVMNYRFREANLGFFARRSTTGSQFLGSLMEVYLSYAPQVSRNMMNLLSSHDTPRFVSLCNGDDALARLGALVQFTWVGAPSVYYGEELGMRGNADPDNRRGMEWSRATSGNATLRWYRALAKVRAEIPALQSGDPLVLASTNDAAAYGRLLGKSWAVVAVNRGAEPAEMRVPVGALPAAATYLDVLTGRVLVPQKGTLSLSVPSRSGAVLVLANAKARSLALHVSGILGSKEPS